MTRRLWVPVLAALLVAALVGPSAVTAVEPRITTRSIMIPAASFIPITGNLDYIGTGLTLSLYSGTGSFTAPLSFPAPVVVIKKITLYAQDNEAAAEVCLQLYRTRPADVDEDYAGNVCTVDAAADPQYASTTVISPRRVSTAVQGPYLWVYLSGPNVRFYGAKVTYTYETAV